ncbi:MAG: 4'-phosphopantetheinyl transferase superfamily protein [Paraglaciecola sp.]|uniref:4'-phosphopantetheinyl transferase family protein n=1 Tax=Paraglaciecola sp. TaxID=1920173 RepID=UPI003297B107
MTRLFNVVKPKFSGASKWGYGINLQGNGESPKFNMILTNDKPANPSKGRQQKLRKENLTPNKIHLYYLDMRQITLAQHELYGILNRSEQRRYNDFKNTKRQSQFIMSRWLIKQCLKQLFAQPLSHDYQLIDYCCWKVTEQDKSYSISISHSGHFIGVAIAAFPCAIGLDIEQHKPRNFSELVQIIGTKKEQNLVCNHADPQSTFYHLWTAKEALLKASKKSVERVCKESLLSCLRHPFGLVAGYHYLSGSLAEDTYSYCVMSNSKARVIVEDFAVSYRHT